MVEWLKRQWKFASHTKVLTKWLESQMMVWIFAGLHMARTFGWSIALEAYDGSWKLIVKLQTTKPIFMIRTLLQYAAQVWIEDCFPTKATKLKGFANRIYRKRLMKPWFPLDTNIVISIIALSLQIFSIFEEAAKARCIVQCNSKNQKISFYTTQLYFDQYSKRSVCCLPQS